MTRRRWILLGLEAVVPVVLVTLWWVASDGSTSFYFPPLARIVEAFQRLWLFDRFASDVVPSLARMLAGFAIAVVLGLALGTAIGLRPVVRHLLAPLIELLRAMPPVALLPIAILLLGVGDEMKVAVIALGCLFPVLLNTVDAVAGIDRTLLETVRIYRIGGARRIRTVILPAALPQAFAGIRTSLALALILMVISEMFASADGLGHFVIESQRSFAIPEMWAGILLIGALGYLFNLALSACERRLLRWHRQTQASALQ